MYTLKKLIIKKLTSIVFGILSININLALSQLSGFPKIVTISLRLGSVSSPPLTSSGSRLY